MKSSDVLVSAFDLGDWLCWQSFMIGVRCGLHYNATEQNTPNTGRGAVTTRHTDKLHCLTQRTTAASLDISSWLFRHCTTPDQLLPSWTVECDRVEWWYVMNKGNEMVMACHGFYWRAWGNPRKPKCRITRSRPEFELDNPPVIVKTLYRWARQRPRLHL